MQGSYLHNWQIIPFWPSIATNYGDAFNKLIYISKAQPQNQAAALQHNLLNQVENTDKPYRDLALNSTFLISSIVLPSSRRLR